MISLITETVLDSFLTIAVLPPWPLNGMVKQRQMCIQKTHLPLHVARLYINQHILEYFWWLVQFIFQTETYAHQFEFSHDIKIVFIYHFSLYNKILIKWNTPKIWNPAYPNILAKKLSFKTHEKKLANVNFDLNGASIHGEPIVITVWALP